MLIECPYCGAPLSEEFTYLGDATRRPSASRRHPMDAWYDYVYHPRQPQGPHREYWHHSGGCRAWLVVERDTLTHEIYAVTARTPRDRGNEPPTPRLEGGLIDRARPHSLQLRRQPDYSGYAGDTLASALLANGVTLMAAGSNITARAAS